MNVNDSIKNKISLSTDKSATDKLSGNKLDASAAGANAKVVAKPSADSPSSEQVTLSPLSAKLKSIQSAVSANAVFDVEKVDAIKSAISSGQFKVDAEKVADVLLETVKDLLNTKKS
jgi:negative regulator of flagellin synthesis FlgM